MKGWQLKSIKMIVGRVWNRCWGWMLDSRHLKFIIIGVAVCYAATIYAQDLMETMRVREEQTRKILGPELGQQQLPREEKPAPKGEPRWIPPMQQRPNLRPKNPVGKPRTPAQAAQYLQAERMEVRTQGTLFLHQMKQRGLPVLRELLHAGRGEARAAALVAMGWIKEPSALAEMAQLVTDPEPRVRQTLATALGLFQGPEVVAVLERLTRDADAKVRAAAAQSLGLLAEPTSIEVLNPLLEDQEESVRLQAALALKRIWSPGKPAQAKEEQPPPAVSTPVREASLKALLRRLETDRSPQVKRYAAEALGGVGDRSALDALIGRLGDRDEDEFVRYGAALAIGRLGGGSKAAQRALRRVQVEEASALVSHGIYDALRRLKLTPTARPGEGGKGHETG